LKDYYYILGVDSSASSEQIKQAYRKLSLKFHPDKNDGDPFFTERFKDIQEAYETLVVENNRKQYDLLRSRNNYSSQESHPNFEPFIEYFKVNKSALEFGDEVTFAWKTINANKVTISPFGQVSSIGEKTYKINNFRNKQLVFELVAQNSNINREVKSSLVLHNKTYDELYNSFRKEFEVEFKTKEAELKNKYAELLRIKYAEFKAKYVQEVQFDTGRTMTPDELERNRLAREKEGQSNATITIIVIVLVVIFVVYRLIQQMIK
jgi:curved DNA-binding protein CbpA